MYLRYTFLTTLLSGITQAYGEEIRTSSRAGQNLLSQARALENEVDYSWLAGYTIQYQGCTSILQLGGEAGGAGGEGYGGKVRKQNLVKFRLCPANSCGKKCGGQYLVEMGQFVESYLEFKQEELERNCEKVEANCYCGDDAIDDETCLSNCYSKAGLFNCVEGDDDREELEIEQFMDCQVLGGDNNNNNNNNNNNYNSQQYYVGAKCANDGRSIYLDTFKDAMCSQSAPSGTFETYYGQSLPYSSAPMISSDCISCQEYQDSDDDDANNNNNNNNNNNGDDANNNNNNGDDANNNNEEENENEDNRRRRRRRLEEVQISEMCERTYEEAAKCEKDLSVSYPNNYDCTFIQSQVQAHEINYKPPSKARHVFTLLLIGGCSALGYAYYDLKNKVERSNVDLSQSDGVVA